MQFKVFKTLCRSAAVAAVAILAQPAQSAIMATLTEGPQGVTLDINGTFDLAGLNGGTTFIENTARIQPNNSFGIRTGETYRFYTGGLNGPTNRGLGFLSLSSVVSGDTFFYNILNDRVGLALSYVSGSPLSGTAFFEFFTLSDLGLSPIHISEPTRPY